MKIDKKLLISKLREFIKDNNFSVSGKFLENSKFFIDNLADCLYQPQMEFNKEKEFIKFKWFKNENNFLEVYIPFKADPFYTHRKMDTEANKSEKTDKFNIQELSLSREAIEKHANEIKEQSL